MGLFTSLYAAVSQYWDESNLSSSSSSSSFNYHPTTILISLALVLFSWLCYYYRFHAIGSERPRFTFPTSSQCPIPKAGPGGLPIIGHVIPITKHMENIIDYFYQVNLLSPSEFTSYYFSLPFFKTYLLTSDPKNVEYVLKTNFDNFVKGESFHSKVRDVLGGGIFAVDGEEWRVQRKTAANIFSVKNFRDFVARVFKDESKTLFSKLNKFADDDKVVFDLQDVFFRFTLDSFCKIGFGVDLQSVAKDEPVPFAVAFDRAQIVMETRFLNPLWKVVELVSGYGRQHTRDIKTIKTFARNIVQERVVGIIDNGEGNVEENNDLLTLFMKIRDDQGKSLSVETLGDYVLNMIIAGRDTTAQALSWTFYRLSENPYVEKKILEEVEEIVGDNGDYELTYEDIKELKYAKAVFLEALRLHPSVSKELKYAVQDDILPDGTFVPANAAVAWSPWVMGRCKMIWGDDASEFKPERWLERKTQPSQFEYPVFNGGPRVCLGKNMAEIEGVFILVTLLREFKVKVMPGQTIVPANSLTHPMKYGLKVMVERR